MTFWSRLKSLAAKKMLIEEIKHDTRAVVKLSATFIGATLVGRSVWGWLDASYGSLTAFIVGVIILFVTVVLGNKMVR